MGYIVMCAHLIKIGHLESKIYRFHFTWACGRQAERNKWNRLLATKAQTSVCFYGAFIAPTMWSETCEHAVAADTVSTPVWRETDSEKWSGLHQITRLLEWLIGNSLDWVHRRDSFNQSFVRMFPSCCLIGCVVLNHSASMKRSALSSLAWHFIFIMWYIQIELFC